MVGSKKRLAYDLSPDNSNQLFYYTGDESNHEGMFVPGGAYMSAAGESVFDITPANVASVQLPLMRDGNDFNSRKAVYESADGRRKTIKVPSEAVMQDLILKNTANINLNITDPDTGIVYALVRVTGQTVAIPKEFDTGLDDGDPT